DGTLVDSEQHGHRVAFNEAFEAMGLPDRWAPERYRDLLAVTGGERRLFSWLSDPESSFCDRPEQERKEMAAQLHRWKSDRFETMATAGAIPAREGVTDWLDDLARDGVRLAVATTGSRQWAVPLLNQVFGPDRFEVVVGGEDVSQRKPDPEAYQLTLERLGLDRGAVVAVEDSGPGWEAARQAGLVCVVVANDETELDDVAGAGGAPLVLDGFGPSPRIIDDRFGVMNSDSHPHPAMAEVLAHLLACATIEP
ncbi:MAG: HAD-IA family hydrolase, partial [Actinomycetota bacterium]|nr:HAD-IA family hydrolase [Actinomycetota bacterium]